MVRVRYTAWDGTQRIRLSPDRVFEKFAEHLAHSDDAQQAFERLLREGLDVDGTRVLGLSDLLEALREALREQLDGIHLRDAFAELRQRLDDILDDEREAEAETGEASRLPDDLPSRISEAIERLRDHQFRSPAARSAFEDLADEADDIRKLEDFQRRFSGFLQGKRGVSFEEAVSMLRDVESWQRLEDALASGRLDDVDMDLLAALLGADAARSFQLLRGMMAMLTQAGLVTAREGRTQLTPRGVRKLGQLALRDIYQGLLRDRSGGHESDHRGSAHPRPESTRPYEDGLPFDVDLVATVKHALQRGPGVPVQLVPDDFQVREAERSTTSSTVLLLDMSWSMSWEGRFAAAKRVALALETLIRGKFPRDYFAIVGFYTRAVELKLRDLPEASWNMGDPFTNLQDGLRLAGELLAKHPSPNQHVIVITDGQPTAYFLRGRLYCEWPLSFGGISMRAAQETLKEVERVTRRGIVINTFMLDDSASLRAFVERMTRINKGRALYTRPDRLGQYLLVDYLAKKKKRV